MATEKNLLSTKRFFNASPIDNFVNLELTSERSFIKPDKTDNVVDLSEKFTEERNACMKFCIYGMIQSKWCDSDSIKIDFRISDSSTNVSASTRQDIFWVYDKSTNVTATTWSVQSRPLDGDGGNLSLNLYRKKKGSYFFPFEIDLNLLNKNSSGINTNKSIYIRISEPTKNAYLTTEIPFLFFDDEGVVIEFGQETADILDNGTVIEINNNYPYFYDRHWLRQELIPTGPPFVSFVSQDSITVKEGTNDPRVLQNKLFPIEVMLSEPSLTGMERVNVEIVYGLDETKMPYTTVLVPPDAVLQQNYVKWNFVGDDPLKYIYLRIVDDFFVEPVEKITLRLTPVFGCVPDPNKSQTLEVFFEDNDVPSYVSFENQDINFLEPRQTDFPFYIPIRLNLDKTVLVDNQYFDIYVDRNESDAKVGFGFIDPSTNLPFRKSIRINVNKTDLSYSTLLRYEPNFEYDKERKIVLRMSGFTTNLRPASLNTASDPKLVIYCNKQIDDNYCLINFPYNNERGNSIVRNVYNVPQADYDSTRGQQKGSVYPTKMAYDVNTNLEGKFTPNEQYTISATTATSPLPNQTAAQKNIKTVVVEQEFQLLIKNVGTTPVVLDYNIYAVGETLAIDIKTGQTLSTSTNVFTYDGEKFILRLPGNRDFTKSTPIPIFQYTGGSFFQAFSQAVATGNITYSATTYGYTKCNYEIQIRNKSYNYLGDPISTRSDADKDAFYRTNLLTKGIFQRKVNTLGSVNYDSNILFPAGNDSSPKNFYVATELNGAITRDISNESSATATTMSLVNDKYFYNGVAIIPDRGFFPVTTTSGVTTSRIFVSERRVIEVNEITRPVSGTSTLGYNAVLPTSPIISNAQLSASTYFCPFNFGALLVQNGYGNVTYWPNGFTQPSATSDAFALSQSVAGSTSWINNVLLRWSSVNPNIRNQAVIEIVNTGQIESYMPNGIVLKPGERLAISELPILPTNGTSGFYNINRPLNPLTLSMSTNAGYDKASGKFLKCKYKISFLNFQLTPTKIVNNSINYEDTVVDIILNTFQVKPRYLLTSYGDNVWIARGIFGGLDCSNFSSSYMQKLSQTNYNFAYFPGIVITASNDSPLLAGTFKKFDDMPPSVPVMSNWRWTQCNGFYLY